MSILLVFTHPASINGMGHAIGNREDVLNLNNEPILWYEENAYQFQPHRAEMTEGLFFVCDATAEQGLNQYLPEDRSELFVLKHQSPSYNIDGAKVEVGHHITGDRFYQPVFDFLIDDQPEKFSRILEAVFPKILPIKLQLLHKCLIPISAPRHLPQALDEQYSDLYEQFWEAAGGGLDDEQLTESDPFNPAYIAALTNLRDTLLA